MSFNVGEYSVDLFVSGSPTGSVLVVLRTAASSGCSVNNGGCDQLCIDDGQSGYFYRCLCHEGFTLQDDGKSCDGRSVGNWNFRSHVLSLPRAKVP